MNREQVIKSTQEQAVAAWVGYLNQLRIESLFKALESLEPMNKNVKNALDAISNARNEITHLIQSNNGGGTGVHGFIAEIAEVGIGNAKESMRGKSGVYERIPGNKPSDIRRGATFIQMKFYESGGDFSLGAIKRHLDKYPDYIISGKKYMIPRDQYEAIIKLSNLSEKEAYRTLSNSGDGLTIRQWRKVNEFFENNPNIKVKDIEPAFFDYGDAQKGQIYDTLKAEETEIKNTKKQKRDTAISDNKPTLEEAGKATVTAAVTEGAMTFVTCIVKKIKGGKALKDFTEDDWKEILKETGIGTAKGGVRGASIYAATSAITVNAPKFYDVGIVKEALETYNKTAAVSANAIVTASFGFAGLINKYRKHEITEQKMLEDSQIVCLDAAVSALSSLVGQMIIPIPWLGAIIGNVVGTMMYQIAKDNFNAKEQEIIKQYYEELKALDEKLDEQYRQFAADIDAAFESFLYIVENAFAVDPEAAFEGSIELAKMCGVAGDDILDTVEKGRAYFLD